MDYAKNTMQAVYMFVQKLFVRFLTSFSGIKATIEYSLKIF